MLDIHSLLTYRLAIAERDEARAMVGVLNAMLALAGGYGTIADLRYATERYEHASELVTTLACCLWAQMRPRGDWGHK